MLRRSPRPAATLAAVLASAAAMTFMVAILIGGHVDLPRALPFLALWTAAPLVAVAGTFMQSRGTAIAFIALAVVAEMSSYISMGGGFVYALVCGPLLLVALVATAVR
jgi:hypothetical protein